MYIFPLTTHYKIPEAMKAVDWIIEALEEGRREADDEADEARKDEEFSAASQSLPGRDTNALEKEASGFRRAKNMQATETSPKARQRDTSNMSLVQWTCDDICKYASGFKRAYGPGSGDCQI
jgi:hypothetical protein